MNRKLELGYSEEVKEAKKLNSPLPSNIQQFVYDIYNMHSTFRWWFNKLYGLLTRFNLLT
jgi:hypothetical protein